MSEQVEGDATSGAPSYEERSLLARRLWNVDEQNLTCQRRNLWGTLTAEVVIPLSDLRPETSRSWIADSDRRKVVVWTLLGFYAAAVAAGIARPSLFAGTVVRWLMIGALAAVAIYLGALAKRIEYALLYYRSGVAAAGIARRGPHIATFAPFVATLQARLRRSAQRTIERS